MAVRNQTFPLSNDVCKIHPKKKKKNGINKKGVKSRLPAVKITNEKKKKKKYINYDIP